MEWVSVKNGLPDEGCDVIGFSKNGFEVVGIYMGRFYDSYDNEVVKVTHWMPLPAPPTLPKKIKVGSILKCINKRELLSRDISILKNADCEFVVYAFMDNDILLECVYGIIRVEANEVDNIFSLID